MKGFHFMKKIFILLLFCSILYAQEITSQSYCVLNITDCKIVSHKNALVPIPPASTVKLLTAMVVIDHHVLEQEFVTSAAAVAVAPTKLGLEKGDKMKCKDLLYALLLHSANDVAVVLAEGIAGSVSQFAVLMNQKAKQLGCNHSNFVTPNGLPDTRTRKKEEQYSCAYDLVAIAANASRYELIRNILACPVITLTTAFGKKFTIKSGNELLFGKHPVYGKTGYTDASRNTFCGFTTIGNKEYAVSIMKAPKRPVMWSELLLILGLQNTTVCLPKTMQNIQKLLAEKGYYKGKIDGRRGVKTIEAIKKFQQDSHLEVDGLVGPATWQLLNK
jgi:D-alanyl-D-alanine carboxypeptidase